MSIESRLSAVEKAVSDTAGAVESNPPVWLLSCSELRRCSKIMHKFVWRDDGTRDTSACTPDEIALAEAIWKKADIHCDRAALNQQIRELEARVNVYSPIVETGTRPPMTEAERQSLDRFWASLPTLPPGAMGPTGPRYRGMPQEEEDYRNFLRLSRVLPVGEL